MSTTDNTSVSDILAMQARVPAHVVHRQFAEETVVLNLKTGLYHGLNASGGRMIEVLERAATVEDAARQLAAEYEQPEESMQADVAAFCSSLVERELLTLQPAG